MEAWRKAKKARQREAAKKDTRQEVTGKKEDTEEQIMGESSEERISSVEGKEAEDDGRENIGKEGSVTESTVFEVKV